MKTQNQIILISWSHVDLAFVEMLKNKYGFDVKIIRYSHHPSWNSNSRSYVKNLFNLICFSFKTLFYIRGRVSIFFGHHLCRMFFIFTIFTKKSFFIYNELPIIRNNIVSYFDRFIFKTVENIYISNNSRLNLLKKNAFDIQNCQILENIVFSDLFTINERRLKNNAVFIGTISNRRFGKNAIRALKPVISKASSVDILPSYVDRQFKENNLNVQWLDKVPHYEVNDLLKNYEFGILSYENDSYNNFYAAPLKIYEYVNMGLRVISLLPNEGIDAVKKEYPELFVDTKLNSLASDYSLDNYDKARQAFLNQAIETNEDFAKSVYLYHSNVEVRDHT